MKAIKELVTDVLLLAVPSLTRYSVMLHWHNYPILRIGSASTG